MAIKLPSAFKRSTRCRDFPGGRLASATTYEPEISQVEQLEARRPITEDAFRGAFDKEAPELSTKLLWGEKEFLELGVELGVEGLF